MTPNGKTSNAASRFAAAAAAAALLIGACAAPHHPSRVLPKSPPGQSGIAQTSGLVYDELMADPGLALDPHTGRITNVTPAWAKKALGRVLDLQQALDECETERRALMR